MKEICFLYNLIILKLLDNKFLLSYISRKEKKKK